MNEKVKLKDTQTGIEYELLDVQTLGNRLQLLNIPMDINLSMSFYIQQMINGQQLQNNLSNLLAKVMDSEQVGLVELTEEDIKRLSTRDMTFEVTQDKVICTLYSEEVSKSNRTREKLQLVK